MINIKDLMLAVRLPFLTASVFPVILSIVWCALDAGKFNIWYALLSILGVILVLFGANTINDYSDWNFSDASNPNSSPFNGGTRSKIENRVPRGLFLVIALVCAAILALIALAFITTGRFFVLYFSLAGLLFGYLYSSPPFRLHSKGLGELVIFLAYGPILSAAVCYVMTGLISPQHFFIGLPAGISTVSILWINQFPDYNPDKDAGKKNLTVRLGLKASRYFYVFLIFSVYLSVAFLIYFHLYPIWTGMVIVLIPGSIKAIGILFKNYQDPKKLLPAQGFTIRFQLLIVLLITIGLIMGHWIY